MRYADARASIKSGDVLAWRGTSFLARMIRMATGGSWSHVALALWLHDRLFVVQSKEGGRTGLELASVAVRRSPCDWIATRAAWTDAIEGQALDLLGVPYSYVAAVEVGFGLAPTGRGQVCSLYCSDVLALAGIVLPRKGLNPQFMVEDLTGSMGRDMANLVI